MRLRTVECGAVWSGRTQTSRPSPCKPRPCIDRPTDEFNAVTTYTLLALSGLAPQVVTEAAWSLARQHAPPLVPERVEVVATGVGEAVGRALLLGEPARDPVTGAEVDHRADRWSPFCHDTFGHPVPLAFHVPTAGGQPLADVTGVDADRRFADICYALVARLTRPGTPPARRLARRGAQDAQRPPHDGVRRLRPAPGPPHPPHRPPRQRRARPGLLPPPPSIRRPRPPRRRPVPPPPLPPRRRSRWRVARPGRRPPDPPRHATAPPRRRADPRRPHPHRFGGPRHPLGRARGRPPPPPPASRRRRRPRSSSSPRPSPRGGGASASTRSSSRAPWSRGGGRPSPRAGGPRRSPPGPRRPT